MPRLHALSHRQHGTRTLPSDNFDARTWSNSASFKPRSSKIDSFCNSSEALSSRSREALVTAEELGDGLATYTTASTTTKGGEQPPIFNHASQNITAVAMLVRTMPEPSTTEGRRVRGELRDLLETAAVQQAESFASR